MGTQAVKLPSSTSKSRESDVTSHHLYTCVLAAYVVVFWILVEFADRAKEPIDDYYKWSGIHIR